MLSRILKLLGWLLLLAVFVVGDLAVRVAVGGQSRLKGVSNQIHSELARNGSVYVPLQDISPTLRAAVIATEDRSFYSNPGVSIAGIGRSLFRDVLTGQASEGDPRSPSNWSAISCSRLRRRFSASSKRLCLPWT